MQEIFKGNHFARPLLVAAKLAQSLPPANDALVEFGILADRLIDPRDTLHQAGQDIVQIVDGKGVIHAELRACAIQSQAWAIPALALGIARSAEQELLTCFPTGYQCEHRIGFLEAGQVEEVTVLTVGVETVAIAQPWPCGPDQDQRVFPGLGHQSAPPLGVLLSLDHEWLRLSSRSSRTATRRNSVSSA